MNIPPIKDISLAVEIYWKYPEIGNNEIKQLFGSMSSATIARLKKLAKHEMLKREVLAYGRYRINTSVAFKAWKIDIQDLEKRMKKLHELKKQSS